MTTIPTFHWRLLHPRYWLTWFGLGVLYLLVLLPYPFIYRFGTALGRFSMRFLKRRVDIARQNLTLCFPELSEHEKNIWLRKNFESVGMGLFETGMAWFWPDWRIQKWCNVSGLEYIKQAQDRQQGILLVGVHFLTLELGARIFGLYNPGIGVYRPNDNPVIDLIQTQGRMRSNKSMLDRKDLKGMVRALKQGEIIWYAPDHDYGSRSSVFAPFFAVPNAATTSGTYFLARTGKPAIIPFTPRRLDDGQGYELLISSPVENFPLDSDLSTATAMNQIVEQQIMLAPEQYMWLHRRFKTRPENTPSLYH